MSRSVTLNDTVTDVVSEVNQEASGSSQPLSPVTLKLRGQADKTDKKVKWTEETVDNEHLGRKKSKCCCVYEKPKEFAESSTESEGECDDCCGHVEVKKKNLDKRPPKPEASSDSDN